MRHEWKEPIHIPGHGDDEQFRTWGADSEMGATLDGLPVDPQAVDTWPDEILRLAARIEELEAERMIRDEVAPIARMPAVDALFESGIFSEPEHEQRPPAASD